MFIQSSFHNIFRQWRNLERKKTYAVYMIVLCSDTPWFYRIKAVKSYQNLMDPFR